ncbi:coiled-coil domain-containing protein 47 [Eurytemora carolleeae]|uniref:coiled-coil domain-containing protein 47 n=1 Tax=Eurytemora carolleeae TaxID=1294199 RepID=UPI000C775A2D|nr:coiled-coil domain-containing protein 47 [Eurytemora carolleeae]|eukprot:XP_023321424.1 coiled-coil domain-containing protein 47-like [Eurytemora affinis]
MNEKKPNVKSGKGVPPLQYANIPLHLRSNWGNYYLEILMITGIIVYFLNFFSGKSKNQKIASQWFNVHREILESQFALVGDDGAKNIEDIQEPITKESENIFTFWCSGRICCEGMLVELKLLKRQDLVGVIANALKPAHDQLHIRVDMGQEDMDNFIFAIASKKSSLRLSKDMYDINTYCPERRGADKYGVAEAGSYFVMSEVAEVASAMLDSKLVSVFKKYPDIIDTIHFSDQYTGPKPTEDQQPMELPQGKKVLIFVFNLTNITQTGIEDTLPLLQLVFYCIDKVKKYKLSREAKVKADKNRSKVAENHWRSIHAAKAEKAAEERERKRREVKERIKEIEDPEKQRKMEERENRKDKKKNQPKMKQLKVKAM